MPLENELGLTRQELNRCDRPHQSRILEGYAKIKGLMLLQNQSMFVRDNKRLNAKARWAYGQLGAKKMASDPPDEYVLGDKTVNQWLPWAVVALLGSGMLYAALQPKDAAPTLPDTDTRNQTVVSGGGR